MTDSRYKNRPLAKDLSPCEQLRLVRLIEESAELSVAATKILRFGPENFHPDDRKKTSNTTRLRKEVEDVLEALYDLGELPPGETK